MPGDQPFDFRNSAIQSTSGVFPLPPTEVADDDHRDAGVLRLQEPELEEQAAYDDRCPEQEADRPQQPGDGAAAIPVPHYLADCVVKVSCVRPASRDASITRTTA